MSLQALYIVVDAHNCDGVLQHWRMMVGQQFSQGCMTAPKTTVVRRQVGEMSRLAHAFAGGVHPIAIVCRIYVVGTGWHRAYCGMPTREKAPQHVKRLMSSPQLMLRLMVHTVEGPICKPV